MIENIIFDLDGTLYILDANKFLMKFITLINQYFIKIDNKFEHIGEDVMKATMLMANNDGTKTNGEVFFDYLSHRYEGYDFEKLFASFYDSEFDKMQDAGTKIDKMPQLIMKLKELNINLIVASNPVFPSMAHKKRVRWAGLNPDDFSYYTGAEEYNYCKPKLEYYKQIVEKLHLDIDKTLMVGNDIDGDMVANKIGIRCFLLDYDVVNEHHIDYSNIPHGNIDKLLDYIDKLL